MMADTYDIGAQVGLVSPIDVHDHDEFPCPPPKILSLLIFIRCLRIITPIMDQHTQKITTQ